MYNDIQHLGIIGKIIQMKGDKRLMLMNKNAIFILIIFALLTGCNGTNENSIDKQNKVVVQSEVTIASYDKNQLVHDSDVIIEGRVIDKKVTEDFEGFPATDFIISVDKVYKGDPEKEVSVRTRGGETDKMIYHPDEDEIVSFELKEKVTVFLTNEKGNRPDKDDFDYFVVGQFQGKFNEVNGKLINKKIDFDVNRFEKELKQIEILNKENKLDTLHKKVE